MKRAQRRGKCTTIVYDPWHLAAHVFYTDKNGRRKKVSMYGNSDLVSLLRALGYKVSIRSRKKGDT
jgi:hypothetical protein